MYIIGAFNLRDFNYSKQNDKDNEKIERDFKKIAQIIKNEKFDVIALQELNSESALNHLKDILNNIKDRMYEYDCRFERDMPFQSGKKDPERYGFIWNIKRLRLLKVKNNPSYYINAGSKDLLRPPLYARFTARGMQGGSNFELRLVNVHIMSSGSDNDKLKEFNILVKQILPRICEQQEVSLDGEIMPAYTFMLGDYNLELNKSERVFYRVEKITKTSFTRHLKEFITKQEEKTSLKKANNQITIEECYSCNYDHFTYDIDLDSKLKLTPYRVEALGIYMSESSGTENKLIDYRKKVSDHVPIKMTIEL